MSAPGLNTTNIVPATGQNPAENRGPIVYTVTTILLVLSTIFIILRLISRLGVVKRFALDDYVIVFAWFLAFGFSFSICWAVRNGLGLHQQFIPQEYELGFRQSEYAFSVLYNPVLMATKTSILLFYLTLSKNQKIFRWGVLSTMAVVNVAGLALTILNVAQCRPVWALFQEAIPAYAVCTDIVTLYLSSAPVNIITDLAILFLPMPILTGMRLPKKQKIILVITFSFGVFVTAVDVVRIAYLQQAFEVRVKDLGGPSAATSRVVQQDDFSWYASLSFMWSAIEVHVGIICACVPSLKPLAHKVIPSILRDTSNPDDTSRITPEDHPNPPNTMRSPTSANFSPASAHFDPKILLTNPARVLSKDPLGSAGLKRDSDESASNNMGFTEFLAMTSAEQDLSRTNTRQTAGTMRTTRTTASPAFFDFYNMKKQRKPMTKLSNREALPSLSLVTILFFMWGFAYGLLSILNAQFQVVVKLNTQQSLALHAIYFGGYLVGPLTFGRIVFQRFGFKATFITGLCVYGVGTLIFWPSAVLTSYSAFMISNFIVGMGVSTLEIAANPFIALCGPPQHAESRLNLSQGVQGIGSVLSPLLAQRVLFKNVTSATSLIDVQWAYLAIALFDVVLAVAFYYMPIPEATDADFEEMAEKREGNITSARIPWLKNMKVTNFTLVMGVVSLFLYVGVQEAAAGQTSSYIIALLGPSAQPFNYVTIQHTVFAVGRFVSAGVGFLILPRRLVLLLVLGMILTSALATGLSGSAGVAMIILYEFFQGGVFPIIFAITLRGLGKNTKIGAVLLTAAISGGAPFPPIQSAVAAARSPPYSYVVVVAISAACLVYPIYLNIFPAARLQVDPVRVHKHPHSLHRRNMSATFRRASSAVAHMVGFSHRHSGPDVSTYHIEEKGDDTSPHEDDFEKSHNRFEGIKPAPSPRNTKGKDLAVQEDPTSPDAMEFQTVHPVVLDAAPKSTPHRSDDMAFQTVHHNFPSLENNSSLSGTGKNGEGSSSFVERNGSSGGS